MNVERDVRSIANEVIGGESVGIQDSNLKILKAFKQRQRKLVLKHCSFLTICINKNESINEQWKLHDLDKSYE